MLLLFTFQLKNNQRNKIKIFKNNFKNWNSYKEQIDTKMKNLKI